MSAAVLFAQNYAAVSGVVFLFLLLGVVAICIPRFRRKELPKEKK